MSAGPWGGGRRGTRQRGSKKMFFIDKHPPKTTLLNVGQGETEASGQSSLI